MSVLRFPIGIPLRGIVRNSFSIARNSEELRGIVRNCEKITESAIAHKTNPLALETHSLYTDEIIENA